MKEEYFDILDEHGNPTGKTASRLDAHLRGLWHRTVHLYLFRKVDVTPELLVHLRSKDKDLSPNTWDTRFGGHLIAGQTIEDAVSKELYEEVGITVPIKKMIAGPVQRRNNYPNCEFTSIFFYDMTHEKQSLHFNDGEVQEVKWMRLDDISKQQTEHPELWSSKARSFQKIKELFHTITFKHS